MDEQRRIGNWKPLPRKVDKREAKRKQSAAVERTKTQVRQRDHYRCRVCGRKTMVVHEHHFRSLGGAVSLANSLLACDTLDGGVCHALLQTHRITPFVLGSASREPRHFDANPQLGFEMDRKVAELVFRDRTQPSFIVITAATEEEHA